MEFNHRQLFNKRTGLPLKNKSILEDIRDGDHVVQLDEHCMETPCGIIKNPYFVEGKGWGYSLEYVSDLHR